MKYGRDPDLAQIKSLLENGHDPSETWDIPKLRRLDNINGVISLSDDDYQLRLSPLLTAVTSDKADVAKLLLQFGANTEARTRNGTTALHEVIKLQSGDLVELLIDHGADIEARV